MVTLIVCSRKMAQAPEVQLTLLKTTALVTFRLVLQSNQSTLGSLEANGRRFRWDRTNCLSLNH